MESTAALSNKIAGLEDEMRIIKGEVKQVLTEIRSAILAQDNPFEEAVTSRAPRTIQIVPTVASEPARVEIVMPHLEPHEPAPVHVPAPTAQPLHVVDPSREPVMPPEETPLPAEVTMQQHSRSSRPVAMPRTSQQSRWSLLTIASLVAWVEEAFGRLGAKRLALLLDLCEVSGYLIPEERQALAGVSELELAEPIQPASPMEVTVLLRQLDALLQG